MLCEWNPTYTCPCVNIVSTTILLSAFSPYLLISRLTLKDLLFCLLLYFISKGNWFDKRLLFIWYRRSFSSALPWGGLDFLNWSMCWVQNFITGSRTNQPTSLPSFLPSPSHPPLSLSVSLSHFCLQVLGIEPLAWTPAVPLSHIPRSQGTILVQLFFWVWETL
jgi:hypothetical protein